MLSGTLHTADNPCLVGQYGRTPQRQHNFELVLSEPMMKKLLKGMVDRQTSSMQAYIFGAADINGNLQVVQIHSRKSWKRTITYVPPTLVAI